MSTSSTLREVVGRGQVAQTIGVSGASDSEAYVLGHSEVELKRLAFQAELVEPITRRLLVEAGVTSGMRVLDVGTGRGDVAFLVADLVGASGAVVGVDRAGEAIAVARGRAERAALANVSFVQGDPTDVPSAAPFEDGNDVALKHGFFGASSMGCGMVRFRFGLTMISVANGTPR